MKISGKKNIGKIHSIKGTDKKEKIIPVSQVEKADENDSVEISEDVKEIANAKELISMLPETRTEVVTEIKISVEEGTYHRESKKVAKKLVDESVEIAKNKKR